MKPILKYAGGKSKEIQYFSKYFPSTYNTYFEPFVGGGAVYFYLEPKKAVLNDVNTRLINFYADVKSNFSLLSKQINFLSSLYSKDNETLYYKIRDMLNNRSPRREYLESALYYFINKTAYSGLIRTNSKGEFNIPFGRYKTFKNCITEEHHKLLQSATLLCGDYTRVFNMCNEEDFMFLDPPYHCTFSSYGNGKSFSEDEHIKLAARFKELKCKALLVIGKTELTEKLYKPFIIDTYYKTYAINIKNRVSSSSTHLVCVNF